MQKKVKSKVQLASCDTIFYVAASSLHQFSRLDLVDQNFRLFIVSILSQPKTFWYSTCDPQHYQFWNSISEKNNAQESLSGGGDFSIGGYIYLARSPSEI